MKAKRILEEDEGLELARISMHGLRATFSAANEALSARKRMR